MDKELKILIVEDLEEHVEIIKRVLEDSRLNTRIFLHEMVKRFWISSIIVAISYPQRSIQNRI